MSMDTFEVPGNIWWGDFPIAIGESTVWELGAVRFAVQRQALEWRIACDERKDGEAAEWQMYREAGIPADFDDVWERFVYGRGEKPLRIVPGLADRPVISRPASAFTVLPGEKVTIYVSTPLWVTFMTDDEDLVLKEFSLLQLSDTWFGPSTRQGNLCYATSTHARLVLDAMPLHAHRATTEVHLKNKAESPLLLERLNLPVPYLGLYHSGDGKLRTEGIDLVRKHDSDTAELEIRPGPPGGVKEMERIAEPRQESQGGLLMHAFGRLFG